MVSAVCLDAALYHVHHGTSAIRATGRSSEAFIAKIADYRGGLPTTYLGVSRSFNPRNDLSTCATCFKQVFRGSLRGLRDRSRGPHKQSKVVSSAADHEQKRQHLGRSLWQEAPAAIPTRRFPRAVSALWGPAHGWAKRGPFSIC